MHVSVCGPFSNETLQKLSSHGIIAYSGPSDNGQWAPLQNLMQSLNEVANLNRNKKGNRKHVNSRYIQTRTDLNQMEGVLYVHDDAILNMTRFFCIAATFEQQD